MNTTDPNYWSPASIEERRIDMMRHEAIEKGNSPEAVDKLITWYYLNGKDLEILLSLHRMSYTVSES